MAILRPIPTDILEAEVALRSEFVSYIQTLIDGATLTTVPGANNDLYFGSDLSETINASFGNDVIQAGLGNDIVNAGDGDDYVLAGGGADRVVGGDGNDFLFGEAGNDTMQGDNGDDAMFGGAGNDVLTGGEGNDWLYGNAGADRLEGGFGDDLMSGGAGADRLTDNFGNDTMIGGAGNDILSAGADNDFLHGGAGADRLSGGTGDDTFYYANRTEGLDIITDFGSGDKFQFSGLGFGVDPGTNLEEGVTFITGAAPAAVSFEATVLYNNTTGALWFDVDGLGAQAAVQIATLTPAAALTAQDFEFV